LEEEGVLANITIGEYPLYFIPFDEDVLSLELDNSLKVQFPHAPHFLIDSHHHHLCPFVPYRCVLLTFPS